MSSSKKEERSSGLTLPKGGSTSSIAGTEDEEDAAKGSSSVEASSKGTKRPWIILGIASLVAVLILVGVLTGVLVHRKNHHSSSVDGGSSSDSSDEDDTTDPTRPPSDPNRTYFASSNGRVAPDVQVPLYSKSLRVYSSLQEMEFALQDMFLFVLNNVADQGLGNPAFANVGVFWNDPVAFADDGALDVVNDAEAPAGGRDETDTDNSNNLNDYQTNTQEEQVGEADVTKSNGKVVATVYGDQVVVFRADTDEEAIEIARLQLPPAVVYDENCQVQTDAQGYPIDPATPSSMNAGEALFAPYPDEDNCWYHSKPMVDSLLMYQDTLVVIATGYAQAHIQQQASSTTTDESPPHVVSDYLNTKVLFYKIVENDQGIPTSVDHVRDLDLHGYPVRSFLLDEVAHIITYTRLQMHTWTTPYQRHNPSLAHLPEDEYVTTLQTRANQAAHDFSTVLLQDLQALGVPPRMVEVTLPTSAIDAQDTTYTRADFANGYGNAGVHINTLDLSLVDTPDAPVLVDSLTQVLAEPTYPILYASTDTLVVAIQGQNYNAMGHWTEGATFLYTYALDGASVLPAAGGEMPGQLPQGSWSLDVHDGFVRGATTIRRWRPPVQDDIIVVVSGNPDRVGLAIAVDGPPERRTMTVVPDLALISSCDEVVDGCLATAADADGRSFADACQVRVDACGPGRVFYSMSTCEMACLDDYAESMCMEWIETAISDANGCVTMDSVEQCRRAASGCPGMPIFPTGDCPEQYVCENGGSTTTTTRTDATTTTTTSNIRSNCPAVGEISCMTEDAHQECLELEADGCEQIQINTDSCEVSCFSRTLNQVVVLKSVNGELVDNGSYVVGKPNEDIYGVRFLADRAYVVTFLRTDPLYSIGFDSTSGSPFLEAELEISGYATYIESLNDDGTLFMAIGQESNPDGRAIGFQASIFRFDPSAATPEERLTLVDRYHDGQQYSSAEYDPKAIRIVPHAGLMIVPISRNELNTLTDEYEYFDGYSVFEFDETNGIRHYFDIDHANLATDTCYYCACMYYRRSMIIQGNVITLKGHSAVSHNIASTNRLWTLPFLNLNTQGGRCCDWHYCG